MPVTRSQKGSVADTAESRLNPANQEPANQDPSGSRGAVRSTGIATRSTNTARTTRQGELTHSSEEATTGTTATTTTTSTESTDVTTATTQVEDASTVKPSKRAKSRRSDTQKKRLMELEAQEKIAELKLEEIRASLALAQARLERQRATEEEEDEAPSASEDEEECPSRVQEWLEGQKKDPPAEDKKEKEKTPVESEEKGRGQGAHKDQDREHREDMEEARPARQPPNVDVTSLAAALTQAVRMTRDAPKYLQELPTFNGQCGSWLAFRAAYYETEALFSKTENVSRLRRSIRGAATEAVSSLLISQPDPGTIMEALERRFGRPDALAMSEMQKMKTLARLSDSPRDLCIFANKVANIVATIEALKKVHYLYNPELVKIIIDKFTPIIRSKWYDYAAKNKEDIPDLKRLAAFLNEEADKCGAYAQPEDIAMNTTPEKYYKKRYERTFATNENVKREEHCSTCKGDHHQLPDCKRFKDLDVGERWEIAKRHRICFRCLRSTHRRGTCRAKTCGKNGCSMAHHYLLHRDAPRRTPSPPPSPTVQEIVSAVELVNNVDRIGNCQAFLKIAPVTITGRNGTRVNTYALMDDGSTITLVDEQLAELLELDGPRDEMWVQGLNETVKHENSKRVDIKIRGKYSEEEYVMRNARTVQRLMFTRQNIEKEDLLDCTHLRDMEDQLVYRDACPKILIGQDNWELLVALEVRTGKKNQPVASRTRLGWVLHGHRRSYQKPVAFCGHIILGGPEESVATSTKSCFNSEVEQKKQKNKKKKRRQKRSFPPEEEAPEVSRKVDHIKC